MSKKKADKKDDETDGLLNFSNKILDRYWPLILKKCKLSLKKFDKPEIELTEEQSYFIEEDIIHISIGHVLNAYEEVESFNEHLGGDYKTIVKDDIIHEAVHYLHSFFYDVAEKDYDPYSEGIAMCLTNEILLKEKESRPFVLSHIAGSLYLTGAKLEDILNEYLDLTKEEKLLIKKMIAKGNVPQHYKSQGSIYREHAEGFVKVSKLRKDYGFDKMIKKPKKFSSYFS